MKAGSTIRTPELIAEIIRRVADGEVAQDAVKGLCGWSTFREWVDADPELAALYARARNYGVEQNEAELMREARRKPADSVEATAQRTLVDTLKWRLSKRLPKDFGDRQQVEHSGKIGLADILAEMAKPKPASTD